eukprot:2888939-Alexandrium_andersonii.AAC.1
MATYEPGGRGSEGMSLQRTIILTIHLAYFGRRSWTLDFGLAQLGLDGLEIILRQVRRRVQRQL